MNRKVASAAVAVLALAGCGSFAPQRYSSNAATAAALRNTGATNVGLANFTRSAEFLSLCRTNFFIEAPEGTSFEAYVQLAIQSELRAAGLASDATPSVTLRGNISELEFSASRNLVDGRWTITLDLESSNGKRAAFTEVFDFDAGFMGHSACRRTAEAFLPAVEKLVAGMAANRSFQALLIP